MSAWDTGYVELQVVEAPGASGAAGQVTTGAGPAGAAKVSVTDTPVTVTLPEFVTRKV